MKRATRMFSGLLSIIAYFAAVGPSMAWDDHHDHDHDHERGTATHRKGLRVVDPHGHEVTDPRVKFRFIVPATRNFGGYYTEGNKYYYTPEPPPPVRGRPVSIQRPVAMEFGARKHHHQLAERLEQTCNELCLDLHYNYRRNRGFQETYGEAYKLFQAAKFIHRNEDEGDHEAIQRSATSIDNLFHHVQGDLSNWRGEDRRPVGQYSLPQKLEEIEALIHHLLYDLGVKPEHDHDHEHGAEGNEAPPPDANEEAPPPQ